MYCILRPEGNLLITQDIYSLSSAKVPSEKRSEKWEMGRKTEIEQKGVRRTTGRGSHHPPCSLLFHSLQSLICLRSSAKEVYVE